MSGPASLYQDLQRALETTFWRSPVAGCYENGRWMCECYPRAPAQHYQVKKEGKNKGRWFYVCAKSENRCRFWMWDNSPIMKPKAVEMETPGGTASQHGITGGSQEKSEPKTPDTNTVGGNVAERFSDGRKSSQLADSKTPRHSVATIFEHPLPSGDGEEVLASSPPSHRLHHRLRANPPPPRLYSTPGKRKFADIQEESSVLASGDPCRRRIVDWNLPREHSVAGNTSPTTVRNFDGREEEDRFQVLPDVFHVLEAHKVDLDGETTKELSEILGRYSLDTQEWQNEQYLSDLIIKAKDAKIASLEAELETEKELVKQLEWKLKNNR